ncbi:MULTISPECIES: hypothetical protein [spotted fever group]|nr:MULTISPECIES: hypothetical protein [spotted fever group]
MLFLAKSDFIAWFGKPALCHSRGSGNDIEAIQQQPCESKNDIEKNIQ